MDCPQASPVLYERRRSSHTVALLLTLLLASSALALDLDELSVTNQGRAYQIQMTFAVAAPVDQVMAVLTDYGFPDRLNPEVTKKEIISRKNGITRVLIEIHSCIFFFCRDVAMIQDVTVVANTIHASVVPGEGDFRSGYLRWSVSSGYDNSAQIVFEAIMEPDFFIPPLIGGFFVRKRLRQEILATAANLETEAAREAAFVTERNPGTSKE
jgi:hypothetical protein